MCLQPKPTSRLTGGGSGRSPAESWDLLKKIPITASNENRKIKNDTEEKEELKERNIYIMQFSVL